MGRLIDNLLNEVHSECSRQIRKYGDRYNFTPKMSVCINGDCYMRIKHEANEIANSYGYGVMNNDEVMGFPIYRVVGEHPAWKIVCEVKND